MAHLRLLAPLAGWCSSLEEAPDPVFAGRMLGDGVLIDPTSATVLAPCDGEVILLPATKHAVTLRAAGGIEMLIHVGIDTVGLAGQGFEQHTRVGAHVRAGEPLISFDMETIAQRAMSLVTPVILTEGHGFSIVRRCEGTALRVGDLLMELAVEEGRSSRPVDLTAGSSVVRHIRVPFEHGIHARPAALLANSIKRMAADVRISANGRQADARSTIALMSLGARCGDEIVIEASGRDARAAVEALAGVVGAAGAAVGAAPARAPGVGAAATPAGTHGAGVAATPGSAHGVDAAAAPAGDASSPEVAAAPTLGGARVMKGVVASRGLAIGRAFRFGRPEVSVAEAGEGVAFESTALENARAAVAAALRQRLATASSTVREIVSAHLELLEDPQFLASSNAWIAKGKSAGWSWKSALRVSIDALRTLNDARMRERIDDLLDLQTQVLLALKGAPATSVDIPENAILIARDLLPSQLVSLDATRVSAICMAGGGPTSHAAILAAAMGIPALVALGSGVLDIANGTRLLVDASGGLLQVDPVDSVLRGGARAPRGARQAVGRSGGRRGCAVQNGRRNADRGLCQCRLPGGSAGCRAQRGGRLRPAADRVPVSRAHRASGRGRAGGALPGVATAFTGRPLVVRTLDIGGDKPIAVSAAAARGQPGARPAWRARRACGIRTCCGCSCARSCASGPPGSAAFCCR